MMTPEMLVKLMADASQLRAEMESAKNTVAFSADGMRKAADLAKTALVGLVGIGSIAAFGNMVNSAIQAQGALHDLSISTGLSVAALGAFKSVGAYTETSVEQIAGAMIKLSKNMIAIKDDTKGAGAALAALGISFAEFKRLSPEQQMLTVAKAMNEFEDGADKSAVAMMLFGKEGAKMLPFLKDVADSADEINKKLTEQEVAAQKAKAAMADAYGDNLTKIRKESDQWKRDLSEGLLPAMYEATEAFLGMSNGAGGIKQKISELSKDGTLAEWGRNLMLILSYVVDAFQVAWRAIESVVKAITGYVATAVTSATTLVHAFMLAAKGDFSGAFDAIAAGGRMAGGILVDTGKDVAQTWGESTMGAQFRSRMADLKGVQVQADGAKKQLDMSAVMKVNEAAKDRDTEATKRAAEEAKKLAAEIERATKAGRDQVAAIEAKNEKIQLEIDLGRKLTPVEEENLKLTRDLASGKIILTAEQEKATRAALEHGEALERERDWLVKTRDENTKAKEALEAKIEKVIAETEKMRDSNAEIGLNASEIANLRARRLEELAVAEDRLAVWEEENILIDGSTSRHRELAKAYRDSADQVRSGEHLKAAKESADEWKRTVDSVYNGLTDSLFRAFEAGKGFWTTLWDGIKNTLKTTVLKVGIQAVMGGLGLSAGGASAGGVSGGMGGFGNLGSLVSLAGAGGSFGAGLGAGFGSLLGEAGLMGGLDAGLIAMQAGNIAGGLGTLAGALGPIALGLAGVYMLSKQLDHSGTPHTGGGSAYSAAGGLLDARTSVFNSGFTGIAYSDSTTDMTAKLVQSIVGILDTTATTFGKQAGYMAAASFADDSSKDGAWGSLFLRNLQGVITDWQAGGRSFRTFSDGSAGSAEYLAAVSADVRAAINGIGLPDWAQKMVNALPVDATLEQIATVMNKVNEVAAAIDGFGKALAVLPFDNLRAMTADATVELLKLTGGLDGFIQKAQAFVSSYYSEGEQAGLSAKSIDAALAAVGIDASTLGTKQDLRALLESIDGNNEAGRKQIAAILEVAPAFASLADFMAANKLTFDQLEALAPVAGILQAQQPAVEATAAATADTAAATADTATATSTIVDQGAEQTGIMGNLLSSSQDTTSGVARIADGIDTANATLTAIQAAVTQGSGTVAGAVDGVGTRLTTLGAVLERAVTAAETAAAIAGRASADAARALSAATLAASAPSFSYDIGSR